MESTFVITTESNAEVPFSWEDETGVSVLRMPYTLDGVEYYYDLGRETDIAAFFDKMRNGASVITAQRNPNEALEYFEPYFKQGKDILHIGFSSTLSGTFNCENTAAQELRGKYPERRIELVDSLTISVPLCMLVEAATRMQREGKSLDEIKDWVESNKQRAGVLVTVSSLEYLRRGGRVSGAAAFFGNVLELKPVLYINTEGKLVPLEKIKGRKKALKYIVERCAATIDKPEEQEIVLAHADCLDDAQMMAEQLRALAKPKSVRVQPIGPVIGSHAGPGAIALAYFCRSRAEISQTQQ